MNVNTPYPPGPSNTCFFSKKCATTGPVFHPLAETTHRLLKSTSHAPGTRHCSGGGTWDHEVLSHLTFFPIKKTMKSLNFEMVLLGMCQVLECVLFLVNSMKFHVIRPTAHPFFCHGTCIYTYYRHISKTHIYLSDTQIYVDYIVVQCTICPYILYTYPLHT